MAIQAPSPPRLPDLDFEAMTAEELIAWSHQFFWPRVCLTCSWQKQSSVLVHMISEIQPDVRVVEFDTGLRQTVAWYLAHPGWFASVTAPTA